MFESVLNVQNGSICFLRSHVRCWPQPGASSPLLVRLVGQGHAQEGSQSCRVQNFSRPGEVAQD